MAMQEPLPQPGRATLCRSRVQEAPAAHLCHCDRLPALGALRRLLAQPQVLARPGGDDEGAGVHGHSRYDQHLAERAVRNYPQPRLQRDGAVGELQVDAGRQSAGEGLSDGKAGA